MRDGWNLKLRTLKIVTSSCFKPFSCAFDTQTLTLLLFRNWSCAVVLVDMDSKSYRCVHVSQTKTDEEMKV